MTTSIKTLHWTFSREDSLLPQAIWNIPESPSTLYIEGTETALNLLRKLPQFGLSIVGTRDPSPQSTFFVQREIQQLRDTPLIVLSGLARGIDACAHIAALDADLPTIGILAGGLDVPYPRETWTLRKRILEKGGLLISEYPPGTPALKHSFLKRNRIIAAWAAATWVVEAGIQSGALNTARWCRELDRPCLVTPCYPGDPKRKGNQILLDRDHAIPYWGCHSLGVIWLDLAARVAHSQVHRNRIPADNPLSIDQLTFIQLIKQVNEMTYDQGGVRIQELLNWALSMQWSTEKFFATLRAAIEQNQIVERDGFLLLGYDRGTI